ncbi:WD repeat domain-containing protein [Dorcoceras hygrometricum]|uniref:WD repeat domain-containing protein n=1 Tax=Dorcoceras hygrometricum TaxID=472368 RepID=A0A2Z7DFB2_9LAMI|nr:WD repeat domain-containing protein [Dorcoceras hygrometricum]
MFGLHFRVGNHIWNNSGNFDIFEILVKSGSRFDDVSIVCVDDVSIAGLRDLFEVCEIWALSVVARFAHTPSFHEICFALRCRDLVLACLVKDRNAVVWISKNGVVLISASWRDLNSPAFVFSVLHFTVALCVVVLVLESFQLSAFRPDSSEVLMRRRFWGFCWFSTPVLLEDERVTPVYLISLLGPVSHYERSGYLPHLMSWATAGGVIDAPGIGHTAGRGGNPAGGAPGGG